MWFWGLTCWLIRAICNNIFLYFRTKITWKQEIKNFLISLLLNPKWHFYFDKLCVFWVPLCSYRYIFLLIWWLEIYIIIIKNINIIIHISVVGLFFRINICDIHFFFYIIWIHTTSVTCMVSYIWWTFMQCIFFIYIIFNCYFFMTLYLFYLLKELFYLMKCHFVGCSKDTFCSFNIINVWCVQTILSVSFYMKYNVSKYTLLILVQNLPNVLPSWKLITPFFNYITFNNVGINLSHEIINNWFNCLKYIFQQELFFVPLWIHYNNQT